MRRRIGRWLLAALGAAIIVALVIYLYSVGLDKADKLSSSISGVLAVTAVVAALFWRRRPAEPIPEPAKEPPKPEVAAVGMPYLEDVKQFAARPALLDRGTELAQLAAFCADDSSSYWRWVADAWSGKTALLASFVLDPPANVDVISFFISSGFNPHTDRNAFIEVVTEQLDALIGVRSSYGAQGPVRPRHLQSRLAEAAELSRRNGRHLVLVVDGLDEDRGETVDSDTYSIAALLPAVPPPGLKLIVAGRPHPPLPPELSRDHPLRQTANIHQLKASPQARANAATAGRDLGRLLEDPLGRSVLGLLTAAGGGLTLTDLATLTNRPRYEITQLVDSSTGRTFLTRPARWSTGPTLGLAHEELRQQTLRDLDPTELTAHRQSLTTWADAAAAEGWPPTTPEYLLRGYLVQLLQAGDLDRAVALVTDDVRHQCLLTVTGGDHAAWIEITEVTRRLLAAERPALGLLARLALHRHYLEQRNSRLPTHLPALWVQLGDDEKAVALALGIGVDRDRRNAVLEVTDALIRLGDERRLERVAWSSDDPDQVLRILTAMITTAFRANDSERIEFLTAHVLRMLPWATDHREVQAVVRALAAVSDDRAELAQQVLTDPFLIVFALLGRAAEARQRGEDGLAEQLTGQADAMGAEPAGDRARTALSAASYYGRPRYRPRTVRSAPAEPAPPPIDAPREPAAQISDLVRTARSLLRDGDPAAAEEPLDEAVRLLATVVPEAAYWEALRVIAPGLAEIGAAERIGPLIDAGVARFEVAPDSATVLRATESLVSSLGRLRYDEATDELLQRFPHEFIVSNLRSDLAIQAARTGRVSRAQALVGELGDDRYRLAALPALVLALDRAGDTGGVHQVADDGWRLAQRMVAASAELPRRDEYDVYQAMADLASACIEVGADELAAGLVGLVQDSAASRVEHPSATGLYMLTTVVAKTGDVARTDALALAEPSARRQGLYPSLLVSALLAAGKDDLAEVVARRVPGLAPRIWLLNDIIRYRSRSGADGWALASELVGPLTGPDSSELSSDEAVRRRTAIVALADGGDYEAPERLAGSIADPDLRRQALAALCLNAAQAGDDEVAERLLEYVVEPAERARVSLARMQTAAAAGRTEQATAHLADAVATAEVAEAQGSTWHDVGSEIAMSAIAAGLGSQVVGLLERLRATVGTLPDPRETLWPVRVLIESYARLSRPDEALAVFSQVDSVSDRRVMLEAWANAAATTGDTSMVEGVTRRIDDEVERNSSWDVLVQAVAENGDYRRAEQLAGDITRQRYRPVPEAIVRAAGQAGDLDFAEELISRFPDQESGRVSRVVELLCVLVTSVGDEAEDQVAGWLGRAEQVAWAGRRPDDRAQALLKVAEVAGPDRARWLVANALAQGPWYLAVAQVARLDPDGLAMLADAVIELVERRAG